MNRRRLLSNLCATPFGTAARAATEDLTIVFDGSAELNTQRFQTAIDRAYGARLNLIGEGEFLGVTIDPAQGGLGLQLVGRGAHGARGSVLKHVGRSDGITIRNRSGKPYNGPIALQDFGLFSNGQGRNGIYAEEINGQFRVEGLWFDGHGASSILAERCYAMEVRSCISNNPGADGYSFVDAGNNIVLDHVKSFGSKRANIRFGGKAAALAPVLIAPDVSFGHEGLVVESAQGVAITGFYSEETPVAARFEANVEFSIQGGLVQHGTIEAQGPGVIMAVHFRGEGGTRVGPKVTVAACNFVSGATRN